MKQNSRQSVKNYQSNDTINIRIKVSYGDNSNIVPTKIPLSLFSSRKLPGYPGTCAWALPA